MTGTWSRATSGSSTCTTNAAGFCTVSTGTINVKKGAATFSIGSVSHAGYNYLPSANHDVDGGSSGSSISVSPP